MEFPGFPRPSARGIAFIASGHYLGVVEPIINMDDPIGTTLGRRQLPKDALAYGLELNRTMNSLQQSLKLGPLPRGVFRFKTHEEADEWWTKHLIARIPRG